jgi:hypothetical protein
MQRPETRSPTLKRSILNVFLAAMLQNVDVTLFFLEQKQGLNMFMLELLD